MKQKCKIKVKGEVKTGVSICSGNPWKRQELVVEFVDEKDWIQRLKVDIFNNTVDALADVPVLAEVELDITFDTEPGNGRVYNRITAHVAN